MKFERLILENIFAYYGRQEIDLSIGDGARNIVVVSGRNGRGKTSLLNAIKLLFVGPTDERIRSMGFPPRRIGANQFVVGIPGRWDGIVNTKFRAEGGNAASVALVWKVEKKTLCAERRWTVNDRGYSEQVSYFEDDQLVDTESDALERLGEIVPRDLVPYFFFDGEQIQALAEDIEGSRTEDIERVLNISYVRELVVQVEDFVKQRRRARLSGAVRVELVKAEGDLRTAEVEESAVGKEIEDLEEENLRLGDLLRRLRRERDQLRGGLSDHARELLKKQANELEREHENLATNIAHDLPVEIPFIVNPGLVDGAYQQVSKLVAPGTVERRLLERLEHDLPSQLFFTPPYPSVELTTEQNRFLDAKLRQLLKEADNQKSEMPSFLGNLSPDRARTLRDRLIPFIEHGMRTRQRYGRQLMQLRQLASKLHGIKKELEETEVMSDSVLAKFEEIEREIGVVSENMSDNREKLGTKRGELKGAREKIAGLRRRISELEGEYEIQQTVDNEVELGKRIERALNSYISKRRDAHRASLEEKINEKYRILFGTGGQVQRISLSENFIMSYRDGEGRTIGRSSISAGMKQIAATALLWALKEETKRNVPVVIDTPLARIDRENQNRLLLEYYPNAGEQVIVLPTDVEIDDGKLFLIQDSIAKRFSIENEHGNAAEIVSAGGMA